MGEIMIACYRPKPGKEEELMGYLKDLLPALRAEGLVTDRPPYLMKAADGSGATGQTGEQTPPSQIQPPRRSLRSSRSLR